LVGLGRDLERPAADGAPKPVGTHEPLDGAASDGNALSAELPPDLFGAVHGEVLLPHATNLRAELLVTLLSVGSQRRIPVPSPVRVVRRRGDRQDIADRLDPVGTAVLVDEHDHHLGRRSSSAAAKYADALRRISFARFSSRTSRSRSFSRARSLVVTPSRLPESRSACRTHFLSVSGVQPIFAAIEWIAAHCDSCCGCCSNTSRTARSRTSGGYLLGLPMAPSSQHW